MLVEWLEKEAQGDMNKTAAKQFEDELAALDAPSIAKVWREAKRKEASNFGTKSEWKRRLGMEDWEPPRDEKGKKLYPGNFDPGALRALDPRRRAKKAKEAAGVIPAAIGGGLGGALAGGLYGGVTGGIGGAMGAEPGQRGEGFWQGAQAGLAPGAIAGGLGGAAGGALMGAGASQAQNLMQQKVPMFNQARQAAMLQDAAKAQQKVMAGQGLMQMGQLASMPAGAVAGYAKARKKSKEKSKEKKSSVDLLKLALQKRARAGWRRAIKAISPETGEVTMKPGFERLGKHIQTGGKLGSPRNPGIWMEEAQRAIPKEPAAMAALKKPGEGRVGWRRIVGRRDEEMSTRPLRSLGKK